MIRTASKAIKETNPECFKKIKTTFTCMEKLADGEMCDDEGLTKVKSKSELSKALG